MVFNTTSKASMDAFNGVPATGIPPAIGEIMLRPSRMKLLVLCTTQSSWRVTGQGQHMAKKVRLFVHRDSPARRGRHHCQYGREACGNGVLPRWCTVIIRPLQDANRYDSAQDTHYQWSRGMKSNGKCARVSQNGSNAA